MDEGIPVADEMLTESRKDDEPGLSVSLAADKGQIDSKLLLAGESKASSVEDTGKVAVTHHKTTEDEGTNSLVPNGLKASSEDNVSKHAGKHSYVEDLMKIYGSKCTTKAEATNVSEKESSVNNRLCLEDCTVQNSKNDQSTQQLDQMPSLLATFNSQNAVLVADETDDSGPSSNFDNSKSETGAVTSGLNSTELALSNSIQNIFKNLPGRSLKDSSDSFSAASQVHFANSVESSNSSGHGQFLDPPNGANVEDKTFGNLPLDMHGHLADGEASLSAAGPALGFITY